MENFTVVQTRIASLSLLLNCNVMNHTDMVSACITMDCIPVTQISGGIICMLGSLSSNIKVLFACEGYTRSRIAGNTSMFVERMLALTT